MYLMTTILVFMTIFLVIHEELEPQKKPLTEKEKGKGQRKIVARMRRKAQARQQKAAL